MKKLIALLGLLVGLLATPALAANCSTYPYTLTNGQTADANQVMANFNSILNCGNNNLAHNGANSDITSLSGLTSPWGVPLGGTGATSLTSHGVVVGEGTSAVGVTTAGTSGQVLTSNGASADPTFQSIPAGGTVTSIATNNGVTGGTITTSGTIGLASITANTALANVTGSSAVPVGVALPSCSATGSALIYTTSSGFGCATGYAPLASPAFTGSPTSGGVALVVTTDSRFGGPTQNGQCTYGLVLTDAGKQIYCNTASTHKLTIPANGSVAFAIGTKIDVVNDCSAGALTIAITTDTLVWFTSGTTGSRTLGACGEATLSKVNSTRWVITGVGLT